MKLEDYKALLLEQDLRQLDRELEAKIIIADFLTEFKQKGISHNIEDGKWTKNTVTVNGLGDFSYSVRREEINERFPNRRRRIHFRVDENWNNHSDNFGAIIRYQFLPMIKSMDSDIVFWGSLQMSNSKSKFIEKINKKWDKYFENLEKQLETICGNPLEEIFFNNVSDKFNQSNATVFSGPKGKAIAWTTISGGYNIQQSHIRMFCKPLTATHIKEFGVSFDD